ncbi:hypothetical protein B0T17DRAFT_509996 [Bombardia bombarda]|uniref:Zn(2)-C6 fungal-type domain-containing protein n=1 Tax=Bombardia bombarda TaxID=252184 RepID=A0AA40BYE5_9PEZI|nr:hypothetical protein B0T17DRAFT_509996 [Bombardia bombarda]
MNNNIRKRRAYSDDDSPAEPVLQGLSHFSPYSPDALSPSADHRYILRQAPQTYVRMDVPLSMILELNHQDSQYYILEQTAAALNIPLPTLLNLSNQQHQSHKRPRLTPSIPMPTPYIDDPNAHDGQEKPSLTSQPNNGGDTGNTGRKPFAVFSEGGFPSGWTGSRIAGCLANFTMCPPCSSYDAQPAYQPIPSTVSYDYGSAGMVVDENMGVPFPTQAQASWGLTPMTSAPMSSAQPALFPCDDPTVVAQYLSNYPPLQPSPVMCVQPATSREVMVYPDTSITNKYDNDADNAHDDSVHAIQGQPQLMTSPVGPSPMPVTYTAELETLSFNPSVDFPGQPQHYGHHQGFEVEGDPDPRYSQQVQTFEVKGEPDMQGRAVVLDLFPHQRTMPARRGPFKDNSQRERTAQTRKIGSCIRCRMQRVRCNLDPQDEKGPCVSCKKMAANTRVYRINCLRWKITDVKLFKPGQVKGYEWTTRWRDSVDDEIKKWASDDSKVIFVTEGYTGRTVTLRVRQFLPQDGDKLDRSWVSDGVKKSVTIPPFAIDDLEAAKSEFDRYIRDPASKIECCRKLLGPPEKLLWRTYCAAMNAAANSSISNKERKLLIGTLDLWMSVRLTTKSFEIIGDEALGMPRNLIDDHNNPLHGKVPLPPVMGAQIDSILIHQLQPHLRRITLEELQRLTQDKRQKNWFVTYLVTFILLHNIALITRHDADYARKHGMKRRFAREENVKEYNLAYFHYCNKGIYPFSAECRDQDLQSLAELDPEAIAFVQYTRKFAAEHKGQWEEMWDGEDYENEYYYLSQLFEPNWQPRTMA